MLSLNEYIINEQHINEAFFNSMLSNLILKSYDVKKLYDDFMDFGDFLMDGNDIEDFFKSHGLKDRQVWKSLYKLYEKGIWGIVGMDDDSLDVLSGEGKLAELPTKDKRILRQLANKTNKNAIKYINQIKYYLTLWDDVKNKGVCIFLTNKSNNILKIADKNFLVNFFNRLGTSSMNGSYDPEEVDPDMDDDLLDDGSDW